MPRTILPVNNHVKDLKDTSPDQGVEAMAELGQHPFLDSKPPIIDAKESHELDDYTPSPAVNDAKECPEDNVDPNVVDWDGPNDPSNPRNWSKGKKYLNISFLSLLAFVTPVASAMFAPGVPKLMEEFHSTNQQLSTFVISIYVLGFAFGHMLLSPLSQVYGFINPAIFNV